MAKAVSDYLRRRLTTRRLEVGLTQAQGGAFVGWDQGSMSKYEHGQLGADIDTLSMLADGYGTSLHELLSKAPTKPDPQWQQLWSVFIKLSARARDGLLAMLDEAVKGQARAPQTAPQARRRRGPTGAA